MARHLSLWFSRLLVAVVVVVGTITFLQGGIVAADRDSRPGKQGNQVSPTDSNVDVFPTTLSQLKGWHGIEMMVVDDAGNRYCSFSFPERFGLLDRREKDLLLRVIGNPLSFKDDVSSQSVCYLITYQAPAFDHLYDLAIRFADLEAARWFVEPQGAKKLHLDGELGERYHLEYRPKVLLRFSKLRSIIPPENEAPLAEEICAVAKAVPERFLNGEGVKPILSRLRTVGMGSLARKLAEDCGNADK